MMHVIEKFQHLKIPLEAIKLATDNFADNNCIGGGGFGKVYKGALVLSDIPTIVALKRLDPKFGQGNPEFWKEIVTLSLYKHENIVSLLGFCDENSEKILIYEYASKGSLDSYLTNDDLKWIQRLQICIGAARGLAYLHDPGVTHQRVLHRDIKSSNILLDEKWNARIADLGLSKFGPANQQYTFLVSKAVGTVGYCDPLYVETGLLTKESDVYSFGVVLFEVLCGRLCIGNKNDNRRPLTELVRHHYEEGNINEIIHANLKDEITPRSLKEFTTIAYRCLSRDLKQRPLMTEIVTKLESALQYQKHVNDMNKKMKDLEDSNNASNTSSTPSSVGDVFKSRERPFNDALKFLQQDNSTSQMIALCGMGGVGKTTMMEQLKADKNVEKLFDIFVKVAIGKDPNMLSIQNDIALCLGGEGLPEALVTSRADSLCRRFKKLLDEDKKKILVILDDVWEKVKLQNIGLTSPLPNGVKLLLTSRDSNICKQIAADARSALQEVRVDILEEAEAKSFFSGITEVLEEDDHNKYMIGCNIVKKCGYLPLAIKIIASTLKSQEDYVWSDTLNHLNNNDLDDNVREIIKISYEHIKDEDKEIFLHCGLFPEDANIPKEDLTRCAWGLKLLKRVSTLKEARQRTYSCVERLISANLLINSDHVGCVKMHDIVLAFVLGELPNKEYASIINHGDVSKWDEDGIGESCKKISLTCQGLKHFPKDFKYPNLSLLQLMHGDMSFTFPEDFYENMKNLKVIAYYKMQYPLLPRSLECSTNLKTLCLHECGVIFDDCSFIGDLVNLEVLSFAHCGIRKLPSTIANLRNLRLLDLTGCVDLQIDDGVFKNLENLEELYMISEEAALFGKPKTIRFRNANFEELKKLSSQLCALEVEFVEKDTWPEDFSFEKLERFKISMGSKYPWPKNFIEKMKKEKYLFGNTLKLVAECSSHILACKINVLFTKTESLYLQVKDMISLEYVIYPYNQRSFFSLRDLEISNCLNLKYLFPMSVARGLKKLERLKISSCFVLEALVHNDGSEISDACEVIKFEKLMFLSLEKLPKLVCLFPVDNVVELPQLDELRVVGLPNFTSIFSDKNNSSALLNSQVKISELKDLTIISMQIVNLFPTNPMGLLNQLESLRVSYCDSIEMLFNIDLEYVGQVELLTNSSLRSIEVSYSHKLREVWRIKGGNDNSSLICTFEALERIAIDSCKRFRNIFTPTNSNSKIEMPALTRIEIHDNIFMNRHEEEALSSEERDESISTVAFPSNLMHSFHYLQELILKNYRGAKEVFEIEGPTTNNQQQLLPNLQKLELLNMQSIDHVWKCSNWKKILILQKQSSFQNLTNIQIWHCNRIKYLFSPLMAKLLSNLKKIDIGFCRGMEEVVSNRDDIDEDVITSSTIYTTNTFFRHLHSLSLVSMNSLKCIGGGGGAKSSTGITYDQFESSHVTTIVPWFLYQYPGEILIDRCKSLMEVFETAWINNNDGGITSTSTDERNNGTHNTSLVIPRSENINVPRLVNLKKLEITSCGLLKHVFTFSTLESLTQLEELKINRCEEMKVIVKEENEEQRNVVDFPRLKSLELEDLPNLEGFFLGMNDFQWSLLENINVPRLVNLKKLVIKSCGLLKHVFTFSTLESLTQLEELKINSCEEMKVIVKEENEEQRNVVDFPRLKSLELYDLPNLEGFFLGMNDFQWPLLEKVMIDSCPKMMVFTSGQSTAPKLEYIHTSLGRHSLECGLNFHVTELNQTQLASSKSRSMEWLPWSLYNLIDLYMEYNDSVETIIPSNEFLQLKRLERIQSEGCYNLKEVFGEPQGVVEIPNLAQLELKRLRSLEYIWKSNHHQRTVLLFPSLTTLVIDDCRRLKHVFTSSMVDSLQQLQRLLVTDCREMEVIVKLEESEFECDATVKEIVLPRLKCLILEDLESLKGFCLGKDNFSWPSLDTLEIIECPEVAVFTNGYVTTPALKVIDTSLGRCYIREDINSFIRTKQHEGFRF